MILRHSNHCPPEFLLSPVPGACPGSPRTSSATRVFRVSRERCLAGRLRCASLRRASVGLTVMGRVRLCPRLVRVGAQTSSARPQRRMCMPHLGLTALPSRSTIRCRIDSTRAVLCLWLEQSVALVPQPRSRFFASIRCSLTRVALREGLFRGAVSKSPGIVREGLSLCPGCRRTLKAFERIPWSEQSQAGRYTPAGTLQRR